MQEAELLKKKLVEITEKEKSLIPICKRYKTNDTTIEKLSQLLLENPTGLLLLRDELAGWLCTMQKYGREGDREFYLESWNGYGSYTVDRIGRGTTHISALCLSIFGGIQPDKLQNYLTANLEHNDDGGLTVKDINIEIGQIHVHRQWLEREGRYGPTKHGKDRFLKYPKDSELASLIEKSVEGKGVNDPLIVTMVGTNVGVQNLSRRHFQKLVKKAGVPRIRFHDLRHTFASWFMIKNDDIWELMRILGHADIQTTQRYAHLSSMQKSVPKFDW